MIKRIIFLLLIVLITATLLADKEVQWESLDTLEVITGLNTDARVGDLFAGEPNIVICHELGICGTGVLYYTAYFDSIFKEREAIPVLFLFVGKDSLELRKFVNGYRTDYLKAGMMESVFFEAFGIGVPYYWPLIIVSNGHSTMLYEIPTPKAAEFSIVREFLSWQ
ncbi:hypothetical protein DRQ36_09910 [bacterium]|nr:MAG: hypothetical protein DRQ36_09910 [bacterium]